MTRFAQKRIHDFVHQAAFSSPSALAIIDYAGKRHTWLMVENAIEAAYNDILRVGVKAGDRVVLVFENCPSAVAFFFAISRLDAIAVPVNGRVSKDELNHIISLSDPSSILFCTDDSDATLNLRSHYKYQSFTGHFASTSYVRRKVLKSEKGHKSAVDQTAVLLFTSGTTGRPKAAMLTHHNLIGAAYAAAKIRGMQDNDMSFLSLPLSHVFGLVVLLSICSAKGAMRLENRFSAKRLHEALQQDVTILPAVPQMHAHLFQYAKAQNISKYERGLLRFVSSGGAPLSAKWKQDAEYFYGIPLQNGYGLTETSAGVSATANDLGDDDISVGIKMDRCEFVLNLEVEGASPSDGIGEICIRGEHVMKGYFRDEDATKAAFDEAGFFRSGDLGKIDDKGQLHIVGRSKELIIRSGFNVYPAEIEAALNAHDDVVISGVVGRQEEGNEEVLAFVKVVPQSNVTEAKLKQFLRGKLIAYKIPSKIILSDYLPAGPTGKILKSKLITEFSDQLKNF